MEAALRELASALAQLHARVAGIPENWVEAALGHRGYTVVENPGKGDCLFYAVGQGLGRTVADLRAVVVNAATLDEFKAVKVAYNAAKDLLSSLETRMLVPGTDTSILAAQARRIRSRDVAPYTWLEAVDTLDQYKAKLGTCAVWGDAEAVGKLEKALGIKLLILRKDDANLAYCGSIADYPPGTDVKTYLILAYRDGSHYELVEYGGRRGFSRDQLPQEIVSLFTTKCPSYAKELPGWAPYK